MVDHAEYLSLIHISAFIRMCRSSASACTGKWSTRPVSYTHLQEQRKDRHTEEVEAESISYAVCKYFGIETGENSFGYIASWSQGKELKELRASLETINKTSGTLISDIERHYKDCLLYTSLFEDTVSNTHRHEEYYSNYQRDRLMQVDKTRVILACRIIINDLLGKLYHYDYRFGYNLLLDEERCV